MYKNTPRMDKTQEITAKNQAFSCCIYLFYVYLLQNRVINYQTM